MTHSVFVFKPHLTYDTFESTLASSAGQALIARVSSHFSDIVDFLNASHTVGHNTLIQLDSADTLTLRNVTKHQLVGFAHDYAASHPDATS